MPERLQLPDNLGDIVVTRLDALGDVVLGTQLLNGLHTRWPTAVIHLIVRPALAGAAGILPGWVKVVPFPFDPRESIVGREQHVTEQLRTFANSLRTDLLVMGEYNRVWPSELFATAARARRVIAFDGPTGINASHLSLRSNLQANALPDWTIVPVNADQRESAKYAALLAALGIDSGTPRPSIELNADAVAQADALWRATGVDPARSLIVFPSSGEQLVRSLDADVWQRWLVHLTRFWPVIVLGSDHDRAVLDAVDVANATENVHRVVIPPHLPGVAAAFIDRCAAYIGTDTGPAHLAAVLGKPTLVIYGGGHRAERFLPVGLRAAAVRMPIGCYGCDWRCPFDRRLCIKSIPESLLFDIGEQFLRGLELNPSVFEPRVFDIPAPPSVDGPALGAVMRQHQQFLNLNHTLIEHHAYLAETIAGQQSSIDRLATMLIDLAAQNHTHAVALTGLQAAMADMTVQNVSRDQAIAHQNKTFADLTIQNQHRDAAIATLNQTMAQMTLNNEARDQAIRQATLRPTFWQKLRRK